MNTTVLRCIVLEDEEDLRNWLIKKLNKFPELEIVGQADNVDDAYRLIVNTRPDVAFMDIHLIGGDAFSLLSRLKTNDIPIPHIVMATGHPEYVMTALNEYRTYIVQYLVKPFVEDWRTKFRKAIDALMAVKRKDHAEAKESVTCKDNSCIFIQYKGSYLRLVFDKIVYIEAAGGGDAIAVMDEGYHHRVRF